MIDRYSRPEMASIWTLDHKFHVWLDVEIAATEAWEILGKVPEGVAERMRRNARFTVAEIEELEKSTHHDVVAFTRTVAKSLGEDSKWLHYGLTSTDVVDTAYAVNIRHAMEILVADCKKLLATLETQAMRWKDQPVMGRTHGVHAEPTTFGMKFLLWHSDMRRALRRLETAAETMRVGKLSGAVGNYGNIDPFVEKHVCEKLGLVPASVSTQVLQRDRHAELMCAIAITGASLEKIATEVRHCQRTELREAEEPFGKGQKGSSTMPHKRNPVKSENVCGLARVLRGYAVTAMEDVALWHERDISHSSAERVIIPDGTTLLDYMFERVDFILSGLLVHPENMQRSMDMSHNLVYAQRVMLALVERGLLRETAYDLVQRLAMQSWAEERDYKELLAGDPEVASHLSQADIDAICRPENSLTHIGEIFARELGHDPLG
ncbi:MAG: adenylosuccinate lyase [Kiritimatiellae bacterium]|nr:adenylosuccinate lyase [Kiritimatiellia bacterium]